MLFADAGRLIPIAKGAWIPDEPYENLDIVTHKRNGYMCRKDCVGVEPGTDEETWMPLSGIEVDANLSNTSTNPVENRAILEKFQDIEDSIKDASAKVSQEEGNAISRKDDGLYVKGINDVQVAFDADSETLWFTTTAFSEGGNELPENVGNLDDVRNLFG